MINILVGSTLVRWQILCDLIFLYSTSAFFIARIAIQGLHSANIDFDADQELYSIAKYIQNEFNSDR